MAKTGNLPVGPTHQDIPIFGDVWYVDGTNGASGNDGDSPTNAIDTVTATVTAQAAGTDSLGDIIYVMPGSYAESVTGNLTKVQIIGTTGGGTPHAVSIRPTASFSYTGTMFEAALKNLMLLSPSSTSKTLPAVQLTNMRYSVIDSCLFIGRDATCIEGLQIGNTDAVATAANCDFSRITKNQFCTFYGAGSQFAYGIKIGRVDYDAGCSVKQCWGTLFAHNIIYAKTIGLYLGIYGDKDGSTVIRDNYVGSLEAATGCATAGIAAYTADHALVYRNSVSGADAIKGFATGNVLGNFTSESGTAKIEGPAMT